MCYFATIFCDSSIYCNASWLIITWCWCWCCCWVVVVFGVGVGVGVVGSVDCCGGDIVVYGRDINVLELRITVRNKR